MSLYKVAARYGFDGFLLSLLGVILLAWLYPYPGTDASPYHLGEVADFGVSVIFFLYGLRLGFRRLRDGFSQWRLHLFVQAATFIVFPLIGLAIRPFFTGQEAHTLWLGIFFLCILPSTVSSSVVMVSIAGGNLPAAIFNASISSLMGVFITPLWLGLVFTGEGNLISMNDVMLQLSLQVLVPVVLGMMLYGRLGDWANRNARFTRLFDQTIILLIVYCSFCQSFSDRLFAGMSYRGLALLALGMIALFYAVFYFIKVVSTLLGFNREDRITAVFCGSKKSLMQGALMSNVMFAGSPYAGIVLLPVMVYHSLQLVIVGIIAQRYAGKE